MIHKKIEETKERLNKVSPSFCLAKWLQVTVHLQLGHTHSCHHPVTHKIPLKELEQNPSALHNTQHKLEQRKMMLKGERPSECEYCWRIEDLAGDQYSDRYLKSTESWAFSNFEEVLNSGDGEKINPKYLEVSFSNRCNFKCAYCNPSVSSKWMKEIIDHGPYPTTDSFNSLDHLKNEGKLPIESEDENPYIKAFWKWMPDLLPQLRFFRMTGGEPLLSKTTFEFLEYLRMNPQPQLNLAVNSNLGVPFEIVKKFSKELNQLKTQGAFEKAFVFTSLDSFGEQAEFIRDGLDMNLFKKNLDFLLNESKDLTITFMVTFNLFSPPKFLELVEYIQDLKAQETEKKSGNILFLDTSYLSYPQFLSVRLAPSSWALEYLNPVLAYMELRTQKALGQKLGFTIQEISKVRRLIEYVKEGESLPPDLNLRKDLVLFMNEYERRRRVSFRKTFPEMNAFFNSLQENVP